MVHKEVCHYHFADPAVRKHVKEAATSRNCDYCQRRGRQPIAAPLGDVIALIDRSLRAEYDNPENCLPYESREGGFQGSDVQDKWDLLSDLLELSLDDPLLVDLCNELQDDLWCARDPFGLPENEALFYSWQKFCKIILHKYRYLFFKLYSREPDMNSEVSPRRILDDLGEYACDLGLIIEWNPGILVYRARDHYWKEKLLKARDLGSVPQNKAFISNRMSPAGIAMFYGALEEKTAIVEIKKLGLPADRAITVGRFRTLRPMRVLDLSKAVIVPSLFDDNNRHFRGIASFIREFIGEFAKPIERDGREHVDYIPTQVVTEYFRYGFQKKHGLGLNGIVYPSLVLKKVDGSE